MTNEKKLELVKKALEQGAFVSINFHVDKNEEEAKELMNDLELPFEEREREGTRWLKYQTQDFRFEVTTFYEINTTRFMEEDVELDGCEEIAF